MNYRLTFFTKVGGQMGAFRLLFGIVAVSGVTRSYTRAYLVSSSSIVV